MKNVKYGSNLTDGRWEYLKPMLPRPAKRGRPPTKLRQVIDAIFYVVKRGIPRRYLPADLPPWQTVCGIFRRWQRDFFWAALNNALRILVRKDQGRLGQPTAAVLDSQSVKSAGQGGHEANVTKNSHFLTAKWLARPSDGRIIAKKVEKTQFAP